MAEIGIDLRSLHRQEQDGSHTVTIEISGLPSMEWANRISLWMRDLVRNHAHQIGWLAARPPGMQ